MTNNYKIMKLMKNNENNYHYSAITPPLPPTPCGGAGPIQQWMTRNSASGAYRLPRWRLICIKKMHQSNIECRTIVEGMAQESTQSL